MDTIDIFPWNNNFCTGIAIVDEQHQKLVEILNQLASHVAFDIGRSSLQVILDELADYAVYHFKTEEEIWHEYLSDDPLDIGHQAVHGSFVAKVLELKNRAAEASDGADVTEELLAFLTRWLAAHILENDRHMAAIVLAIQSGMSVDDAKKHAHDEMSADTRVLIDLILGIYQSLCGNTLHLMRELNTRKAQENVLQLQTKRAQAMLELPKVAEEMDETTFMQRGQEMAEDLTGSLISFIHFVNDDEETIELVTWSRRTIENFCHAAYDNHYPVSKAGIWADALRSRQPVVFNDYSSYPQKHGLPEGHSELIRLISVPVIEHGKVVMLTGVGNKATDYTDFDVETVQLISNDIWRTVQRRRGNQKIKRLNQLYTALSHCNQAIARYRNQEELFQIICQDVVELGGMKMAWIGFVDPESQRVQPVAIYGEGNHYLEGIEISVDANMPGSHGPTGTAIRENRPFWCQNFKTSPATEPWHATGAQYGWAASASLPLTRDGAPIGAITVYADMVNAFDAEVQQLLIEMATDVSFALDNFAREERQRLSLIALEDSEQRFRSLIEQSIAGAYIVQDDKFAYVNPRCEEILGYTNSDALVGLGPLDVVSPKDRATVAQQLRALRDGATHAVSYVYTALRKNGSTVEVGVNNSSANYLGRPAIIGLMQDISDKKVAEEHILRYANQLQTAFMQTVGLTTMLSEMRDPYTAGHERRVSEIAVAIGTEMGLDKNQLEGLRVGGYLHDVGKTSVPLEILVKPGRLNPLEYEMVKSHPRAGYEVLKDVDFPWPVAQIALQHHERVDGSGYPQGFKGEEILLESRIIAVADVIEAMASHRPYRPGLGIEKALEEIENGRGSSYDPVVANACLRLFREKGYTLPN